MLYSKAKAAAQNAKPAISPALPEGEIAALLFLVCGGAAGHCGKHRQAHEYAHGY
jgi:hypothetical protein